MVNRNEKINISKALRLGADYIMLNSVATDSSSLFYGRAGMSICLFETARFLDDKYIEDYAFTLLQQSLVNEKTNITLEAGLSGIGYALNYLIRNHFVDANYMEVFQNQHEIIVREFLKQNFEEMNLKKLIMQCGLIPYFYYVSDKVANEKIIELHEICITKFKLIWEHLEKNTACLDKELISTLWLKYLKCISFKTDESVCPLIKEYLKLLQKGILKRNIQALHYISAFITPQSEYSNLGLSVSTVTTKTIHDFIHVNSINLKNFFSDPFLSCDLIRNGILTWFTDKKSNDLEKMLNNRLEMSPITAALSFGLSGLMLGVISIKNRNRRIVNDILSLI